MTFGLVLRRENVTTMDECALMFIGGDKEVLGELKWNFISSKFDFISQTFSLFIKTKELSRNLFKIKRN